MAEVVCLGKVRPTVDGIWSIDNEYDVICIVKVPSGDHAGIYISTKPVPAGVNITDDFYWFKLISLREGGESTDPNAIYGITINNNEVAIEDQIAIIKLKTINSQSIVGEGNIEIQGGGSNVSWDQIRHQEGDILIAKITIGNQITEVYAPSSGGTVTLIDNHTTENSGQGALDAHQGKVLYDLINSLVGTLSSLNTEEKSNLVAAINEIVGKIGNLNNLDTTSKTNLVAAINEIFAGGGQGINYVKLTQLAYDALETKDPNVLYIIVD